MPNPNVGLFSTPAHATYICKDVSEEHRTSGNDNPGDFGMNADAPKLTCVLVKRIKGDNNNRYRYDDLFWGTCPSGLNKDCKCGADAGYPTNYTNPPANLNVRSPTTGYTWQTCTACDASTSWVSGGTGSIKRDTGGTCTDSFGNGGVCKNRTAEYKCEPGYYGSPTASSPNCTRCPDNGVSSANSTSVTSCYQSNGNTFSDAGGSGKFFGTCYYKL